MTTEQRELSDYLTPARAARYLDIAEATLRDWTRKGWARSVPTPASQVYSREELDRLLRSEHIARVRAWRKGDG